jgi:hypothetical protein
MLRVYAQDGTDEALKITKTSFSAPLLPKLNTWPTQPTGWSTGSWSADSSLAEPLKIFIYKQTAKTTRMHACVDAPGRPSAEPRW